jgi:molybdenum cofactor synthesis domain-containing protein
MRKVPVHDAVGLPLGHDITEIRPADGVKHRAFRRGHVVTTGDVERLLDLGKAHVFVEDGVGDDIHEDDAALTVAPRIAAGGVEHDTEPCEGRIALRATRPGVLRIDASRLARVNAVGVAALPTLPNNYPVRAGDTVAAFRIIPLTCTRGQLAALLSPLAEPLLRIDPYVVRTAGVLVTGTEVYEGRITDAFVPRLAETLAAYDVPVVATAVAPDDRARIAAAVADLADRCDLLLITGGTSVDPDDVTALAMTDAGVEMAVRGVPIQPGNNLAVGYRDGRPVCAVPAAALMHRATALDLLLPRMLAGERITRELVTPMGLGGLAPRTADAHFPDTAFGAGGRQ